MVSELNNNTIAQIEGLFNSNIVIIPLLGYSNNNQDYQTAKTPAVRGWNSKDYKGLTEEEAEKHLQKGGWLGLRIPDGYILVDVDDKMLGEYLAGLIEKINLKAHIIRTPNGWQFFFQDNKKIKTQGAKLLTKGLFTVDYRLPGRGYIVLPAENTENREWVNLSLDGISQLPVWLEPLRRAGEDENIHIPISVGERNDTLFRHCCRLRNYIKDEEEIRQIIYFINRCLTEEPLVIEELENILKKREEYDYSKRKEIGEVHYTEFYNADKFVEAYKNRVLYCKPWDAWLIYADGKWERDNSERIIALAKNVIRSFYGQAKDIADDNERRALARWALKNETKNALSSMIELAKPDLSILPEHFDKDIYLLNLRNGTYDLIADTLLEHDPQQYLTMMADVEYDQYADCPRWMEFLNMIFNENQELIEFIQKAIGYSLSGDTGEDCFFILYGTGMNGKSTFLNTIQEILGDYAIQARAETFLARDNEVIPNDIARLNKKRLVIATEFPEGRRVNENLIKSLTGRDTISARFLRQEYFDFSPTFKIWLGTNNKPVVNETTVAFWRRVKLIPFDVQISEKKRIPHYENFLLEERSGILNWALEGFRKWKRGGLGTTERITEAVKEYREDSDIIAEFIEEKCFECADCSITSKELYAAYSEWAIENKEQPISKKAFGRKLEEKGYKHYRSSKGRGWKGIGLK